MKKVTLGAKQFIGIAIRTTNNKNTAVAIGGLWQRFMGEGILAQIPNRVNDHIYSIYTEYDGDHTDPYTTLLGCEVTSLKEVPEGFKTCVVAASKYIKFAKTGNIMEGFVYKEWLKIWAMDLDRTYKADFEVYGEKSQNPANAEVEIYIGVNG
jgi:predicted transcriptional regulator YdeE